MLRIRWRSTVAQEMESRNGKQCRERYRNHLNPDIKHTAWSTAEDKVIIRLHSDFGSKWRLYTKHLPGENCQWSQCLVTKVVNLRYDYTVGRGDNAIKNRWHSLKRSQQNQLPKPWVLLDLLIFDPLWSVVHFNKLVP